MTNDMKKDGQIACGEAVKKLWEYLDDAVSTEDHLRIEAHLSFCRSCCGEMEFARELQAFLRTADADDIPRDVRARLERFVGEL